MDKLSYIKSSEIKRIDVYQFKIHNPYTCDEVKEKINIFGKIKIPFSPKAYIVKNEKFSTLKDYMVAYNKCLNNNSLIYKEGQLFTKPYVNITLNERFIETFIFDSFDEAKKFAERLADLAGLICFYDTN